MKKYKGLSLKPEDAFIQISKLIDVGMIISVSSDDEALSDCVFHFAKQYAEAAHDYAMENKK